MGTLWLASSFKIVTAGHAGARMLQENEPAIRVVLFPDPALSAEPVAFVLKKDSGFSVEVNPGCLADPKCVDNQGGSNTDPDLAIITINDETIKDALSVVLPHMGIKDLTLSSVGPEDVPLRVDGLESPDRRTTPMRSAKPASLKLPMSRGIVVDLGPYFAHLVVSELPCLADRSPPVGTQHGDSGSAIYDESTRDTRTVGFVGVTSAGACYSAEEICAGESTVFSDMLRPQLCQQSADGTGWSVLPELQGVSASIGYFTSTHPGSAGGQWLTSKLQEKTIQQASDGEEKWFVFNGELFAGAGTYGQITEQLRVIDAPPRQLSGPDFEINLESSLITDTQLGDRRLDTSDLYARYTCGTQETGTLATWNCLSDGHTGSTFCRADFIFKRACCKGRP